MVQVLDLDPRSKIGEMLGMGLGQGLGTGLATYFANRSLNSVLQDKSLEGAPLSKKLSAIQSTLLPYGEIGEKLFNSRVAIEQQEHEEATQKNYAKAAKYIQKNEAIPEEVLGTLPKDLQIKLHDFSRSNKIADGIQQSMLDSGVPPEVARTYADVIRSTEKGEGRTHAIQAALDQINRSENRQGISPFAENMGSGKFSEVNPEFEFPKTDQLRGFTPKERASIRRENTQENLKLYNENRTKKKNLDEDKYVFNKLEQLSPNISTGIAKWNINPLTGEIIFPALATPEERQFGKLLVRQLRNAKDTFGARVTNFDAQKYLEGFPGLGDSPEAREAIIKDLQLINALNLLHADAMEEVYRTYKPGEISPMQAEQIADDIARPRAEELMQQFAQGPQGTEKSGEQSGRKSLAEHFNK